MSKVMETIEQLRKALPRYPEVRETLELYIALLEARARANPPPTPSVAPWRGGGRSGPG